MNTHREPSAAVRVVRPIAWGVGIGLVVCTALLMIAAAIMTGVSLPSAAVTPIAWGIAAVSAFFGGFFAARISRERGLLLGAVCGLVVFLLTAAIGLTVSQEVNGSAMLLKAALMLGAGAVGGIVGVNVKHK